MVKKIYNVPASCAFADVLARKFLDEYAGDLLSLTNVLFLLPNRRACQTLKEAFVRERGLSPTLLPQMMPIGDVEEDELFLRGFDFEEILRELPPAIDAKSRLLWFTRRIMAQPGKFGLEKFSAEQACYLAQELCSLIDAVYNEQLSFDNLKNLVPEEYAAHWLETLSFLEVVTQEWPDYLREKKLEDPGFRRNLTLALQCRVWQKSPPDKRIVIAGTTATFPAMKNLVKTVLSLPQGELILYGLDKFLDETSWKAVDESHPQFELKDLLEFLQTDRASVRDLVPSENVQREKLISEIMRPAKTTDKWRDIAVCNILPEAWSGLKTVSCRDVREEAIAIALIMRETLEIPQKTAALVTTDRNLARRVAAELERWEIKVDDSAGKPLSLTPPGMFLRLILQACRSDFAAVDFLALLKHPLLAAGGEYGSVRRRVRDYEKSVLRADVPGEEDVFIAEVKESLRALHDLLSVQADFKKILEVHIKTAEKLAETSEKSGADILWRGEAGEAGASFIAGLYAAAEILGNIAGEDYPGLLDALMAGVTVRPKYGTHPRLKILGPIEARLNDFDVVIIGEVNENLWPKAAEADPWMSRPMKRDFGMPLPEKAIGVLAHDFSCLAAGKQVFLTRADRVQGTPMVKSRWWMRLETVLKALNSDIDKIDCPAYRHWAGFIDRARVFKPLLPPEPTPPVFARPRELSASAVENLMRDPYIIFAKYILRLKKLNDLDRELNFADYGNIVHAVLEAFNNKYSTAFPENAKEELLKIGEAYFAANQVSLETRAFWWPNFEKTVDWLVGVEQEYRKDVKKVHNEVKGELVFQAPEGVFKITAKADRVDETADGRVNVIDYKTGQARTKNELIKGYAPQLPIEGLIAAHGGFSGIAKKEVASLIYWQLGKKAAVFDDNIEEILHNTFERIHGLAAIFDLPTTPYICQPNPKHAPKYSDYQHLGRVAEWSVTGEDGE